MSGPHGAAAARAAADAIRGRLSATPRVAIVLGSGLGGIADAVSGAARVAYRDIPGFPAATIAGHAGELIAGTLADVPVVALSGRFHMYEGHDASLAAYPVRVAHALGAQTLIVSNAAGSLRHDLTPGTLVLIADHINLTARNPLAGPMEAGDVRFPDMSGAYDATLRATARDVAAKHGIRLADGVYVCLLGPSYETPAEIRMLAQLGGDVVGMSTVPEVIVARAMGMRVLGFSCVTNFAAGLSDTPITHAEVLEATARVASALERIVRGVVATL